MALTFIKSATLAICAALVAFCAGAQSAGDADLLAAREAAQRGQWKVLEGYRAKLAGHILEPYPAYWLLAGNVERRDRFVGLHFFNPPHVMKLIEIVRGERTSDATVDEVREVAVKMGKQPIVVRDSPGFATSRLGVAIGLEAIRMLEDGVASAEDIDRAMELGYNHPMGPLRLTDFVGLDVRLHIAEYLAATLGPRFEPPQLLRTLVAEGKLGEKTGQGFYTWGEET